MIKYNGFEYLLIDAANAMGMDKELFPVRIQWAKDNLDNLEALASEAEEYPLYVKAVLAIRDAQNHIPTGHMMGLDACSSGSQIMGAIMGCYTTCLNTGLVDPTVRPDAYTSVTGAINSRISQAIQLPRKLVKDAVMPWSYGSEAKPEEYLVKDSPAHKAFPDACYEVLPGVVILRRWLIDSWEPFALEQTVVFPDGFTAVLRRMVKYDGKENPTKKIEVDEINHATFSHIYQENAGKEFGVSNCANPIHGLDGMIVREIGRRCNYTQHWVENSFHLIGEEIKLRGLAVGTPTDDTKFLATNYCTNLTWVEAAALTDNQVLRIGKRLNEMLGYKPFPVVAVHDEMKCSPNNMNTVRYWYKEILAEFADSDIASDILTQLYGSEYHVQKMHPNMGELIRKSEYALA